MTALSRYDSLDIDWDLTPEDAVTMYLEWGNNDWHSSRPPVRSKSDESIYFVVDTWGEVPAIRLVRRNSENCEDITSFAMPEEFLPAWRAEHGTARGVFAPGKELVAWLRERIYPKTR